MEEQGIQVHFTNGRRSLTLFGAMGESLRCAALGSDDAGRRNGRILRQTGALPGEQLAQLIIPKVECRRLREFLLINAIAMLLHAFQFPGGSEQFGESLGNSGRISRGQNPAQPVLLDANRDGRSRAPAENHWPAAGERAEEFRWNDSAGPFLAQGHDVNIRRREAGFQLGDKREIDEANIHVVGSDRISNGLSAVASNAERKVNAAAAHPAREVEKIVQTVSASEIAGIQEGEPCVAKDG